MNTEQIRNVIQRDTLTLKKFGGVFAENNLPKRINVYPYGLIVNSDPDTKPGRHWLAMYFPSQDRGEFFDSFGRRPDFYSKTFVTFLNGHCKNWVCNEKTLQSVNTTVCGEYCIFYLMHRSRGISMSKTINFFTSDKLKNDVLVYEFVMNYI